MIDDNTIEEAENGEIEKSSDNEASQPTAKKNVRKKLNRAAWRRMLNYRWIVTNIPFFLFLAILAVVYIYNGHLADKTVRHMTQVNKELKELKYEYKTMKSEVMFRSKQSELAKAVEPFGLKELLQPPIVLNDSIK